MEMYGPSLREIIEKWEGFLSGKTVLQLGIMMVCTIYLSAMPLLYLDMPLKGSSFNRVCTFGLEIR